MSEVIVDSIPASEPIAEVAQSDQNPTEQAKVEAVEPETQDQKTDKPVDEVKKSQSRFDRKIDKAYKERAQAQAEANYLRQQLEELKPKPVNQDGYPRIEDFNDIESYTKAYAEVEKTKAIKEYESKQRNEYEGRQEREIKSAWEQRSTEAESKYDDFDEVVGDLPVNVPWTRAIMAAENGAEIAYYLGKNIKEAARIASLDTFSQAREIGKLEARFENEPKLVKKASNAPAPIKPLSGGATNFDKKLSEVTSQDDFEKRRKEYIKNRS